MQAAGGARHGGRAAWRAQARWARGAGHCTGCWALTASRGGGPATAHVYKCAIGGCVQDGPLTRDALRVAAAVVNGTPERLRQLRGAFKRQPRGALARKRASSAWRSGPLARGIRMAPGHACVRCAWHRSARLVPRPRASRCGDNSALPHPYAVPGCRRTSPAMRSVQCRDDSCDRFIGKAKPSAGPADRPSRNGAASQSFMPPSGTQLCATSLMGTSLKAPMLPGDPGRRGRGPVLRSWCAAEKAYEALEACAVEF
jgi:hypothetical protein